MDFAHRGVVDDDDDDEGDDEDEGGDARWACLANLLAL